MDRNPLRRIGSGDIPRPESRLPDPEVDAVAAQAIAEVRQGGEAALRAWAERLGELRPGDRPVADAGEMEAAFNRLSPDVRAILEAAASRIRAFASAQRSCFRDLETQVPGGRAGHRFIPVARAGCYVPGGRHPLPSSALMTTIPAAEAGVGEIWCAGPNPTDATLAAAWIGGAKGFLRCGGAHGVSALAFGVLAPPCDVIVGPGGRYVASAKRQLFGVVGTEAPAGPSELLVIADASADPPTIAADLIAQAEHDVEATPMCVCLDESTAASVEEALSLALSSMPEPNRSTAEAALAKGWLTVAGSPEEARAIAELCAPEHLELHVADSAAYERAVRSAGAVFTGSGSAEVFGDYGAGPNHTLPTGGAARFAAGLSVANFLRARTWLSMDEPSLLAAETAVFARLEGLEGHARAAEARL